MGPDQFPSRTSAPPSPGGRPPRTPGQHGQRVELLDSARRDAFYAQILFLGVPGARAGQPYADGVAGGGAQVGGCAGPRGRRLRTAQAPAAVGAGRSRVTIRFAAVFCNSP
ncbi:hypothetical protein ACE1SV_65200 [Streptomyces sennicomposti]